jgi:hypothetical protein
MIAGIVEEAISSALKRDLKNGICNGVQREDLVASVDRSYNTYRNMSHKDELDSFTADWKSDVKTIKRI